MWYALAVICFGVIGNALPIGNTNVFSRNEEWSPQVQTGQGPVVGTVAAEGHFEFYGIPYADSTAGSHRFKAPLPPPLFTDVFTANRRDVRCMRPLGHGFDGTEDCLVVDIFTPSLDETRRLPVMVWVKGSEFTRSNENDISFKNIVQKDVIVVSLNYRKSIFGFLCLGTETAPGNAGLKDIISGLRWVKENIGNFGGNPDEITLVGHGSGAAAVDLVTLSPMAEGLVQRAISQSGNALAPWAVSRDNLESAIQVAEALGHNDVTSIEELSDVFSRVSASALMAVINEFELTDNSLVFAPCVERTIPEVESFLVNTPFEIISEGRFLQIPFMTGFVENEGTIRAQEIENSEWLTQMEESFTDFLQPDLEFVNDDEKNRIAAEIKTFYFEDNVIPESIERSITYHGDTMVLVSAIREARLRVASSSTPLYLYQFSYQGDLGQPFVGPIEVDGAAHSEELAYLFHGLPSILETNEIPDRDLTIADILIERWTNFAKDGTPISETSQVEWLPFTIENPNFLHILDDDDAQNIAISTLEANLRDPHPETLAFWNEIYAEHFLDAQSNWEIIVRDDENEENEEEVGSTPAPEEIVTTEDSGTTTEESTDITTETPEPQPDSASTAVGYTFLIISFFALLDKFHSVIVLS